MVRHSKPIQNTRCAWHCMSGCGRLGLTPEVLKRGLLPDCRVVDLGFDTCDYYVPDCKHSCRGDCSPCIMED